MKFWIKILLLNIVFFNFYDLMSQDILTPEMAIEIAKKQSLSLKIAENQFTISKNNYSRSNSGKFGGLNLNATLIPSVSNLYQKLTNNSEISRNFALANSVGVNLNYSYPLYDGNRSNLIYERLGLQSEQQKDNINNTIQNLTFTVLRSYFNVVHQKQLIKFARVQLTYLDEIERITTIKDELGKTNNIELLQTKSDVLNQKLMISRLENDLKIANNMFSKSISEEVSKEFAVVDSIEINKKIFNTKFNNPILSFLEKQNNISELQKAEQITLKKPRLNLLSSLTLNRADQQAGFLLLSQNLGFNIGLQASYNILDGGNNKRQIENANIEIENNKITAKNAKLELSTELKNQIDKYENEWSILQNHQKVVDNNKSIYNLALERFKLGRTTILDLAKYQRNYEESYLNYLNSIYNIKLAEINIQSIIGF